MPASRKQMSPERASSIDTAAVDRIVTTVLKAWRAPGAAVAIVRGDETYVQGYGIRDITTGEPVTPETLFAIGSISKAFTTTAMAMLVEEGKLAWDDHPRKYIPCFTLSDPVADANVTLRDLACHRTGMPRHDMLWFARDWDREEVVRRYGLAPSKHPFRTTFEYANIPYMAAGLAVGAAAGSSWEEFVQARILDPLGMHGANFSVDATQLVPDHASPHVKHGGNTITIPWRNLDRERPAGGINAGVRDMSKWLRLLLNGGEFDGTQIVATECLRETQTPHIVVPLENPDAHGFDTGINLNTYCLGWDKLEYRGQVMVGHGGMIDGFTAYLGLMPRQRTGFVLLHNSSEWPVAAILTNSLRDLLLDLPRRNWTADYRALMRAQAADARKEKEKQKVQKPRYRRSKPSRELDAYTGEYDNPAYGMLSVARDGDLLIAQYGAVTVHLKHLHFNTFQAKLDIPGLSGNLKVHFAMDANGIISSLRTLEPWFEAEFTRKG